ncbi:MAG TPA: hypothetical protein VHO01_07900 [Jatrophihabitans sp.]|nr:hypothetical protein [Jatrophihabitans sp.]
MTGILNETALAAGLEPATATSLYISAIAPVLVVFDRSHPDSGVGLPYWYLPNVDSPDRGVLRTMRRVGWLKHEAMRQQMHKPCITDLIGYLGFRLTNELTVNACSVAELSIRENGMLANLTDELLPPEPVACISVIGQVSKSAREACGLPQRTHICAGGPDSLSAPLGIGERQTYLQMIYLGTFGSLYQSSTDLFDAASAAWLPDVPYHWRVSSPGFGGAIERMASSVAGPDQIRKLAVLDSLADSQPAGSEGCVMLLPLWDRAGITHGEHRLVSRDGRPVTRASIRCRAALESLGIALNALAVIDDGIVLRLAGGGTRSSIWQKILATVLGRPVVARAEHHLVPGTTALAAAAFDVRLDEAEAFASQTIDPEDATSALLDALSYGESFYAPLRDSAVL